MIDSRIKSIMNFVRVGSFVADIGADHAYLSIELAKNHIATKIIATEKNIHPFNAANNNIHAAGLQNLIEMRLGDGLQVLNVGEVDTICIAGMGGSLIQKILDDSPEIVHSARNLIIQPMNGVKKIRKWLADNNWTIIDEDLAESAGIIYEIICADKFSTPQKVFKRDSSPLLNKFLAQQADKLQKILDEMSKSPLARTSDKFFALQAEINSLRQNL